MPLGGRGDVNLRDVSAELNCARPLRCFSADKMSDALLYMSIPQTVLVEWTPARSFIYQRSLRSVCIYVTLKVNFEVVVAGGLQG